MMKNVMVIRHVPEESLGSLQSVLCARGLNLQVVDCFSESWPAIGRAGFDPPQLSGLVVMGGTMNVDQTDRHPFLATEINWLRQAVACGLPTLGICLGAQLLAAAIGGRVYPNRVKEIGWYEIELLSEAREDPLLAGSHAKQTVFEWHSDTFDLPERAVPLARGATCAQQAFRYGPAAWGLQFHLEMTAQMVVDWLAEPGMCAEVAGVEYIDAQEISRRAPAALRQMTGFADQVFGRFAALCRERAS
jgi:GMP synthase (glutamine-hydrolysing)